jgi:hypothetical protein
MKLITHRLNFSTNILTRTIQHKHTHEVSKGLYLNEIPLQQQRELVFSPIQLARESSRSDADEHENEPTALSTDLEPKLFCPPKPSA